MNRPEVRIIEDQKEEIKEVEISQYEREMLLGKYGYIDPQPVKPQNDNGLTFDEMIRIEEQKQKEHLAKQNGPKPIAFDGEYHSNTKYDSDDLGFSYKISIVSNMEIPK